ncbi:TetR family transcriptional regulator [Marinobacterium nitratireducens]|uniref:TetR family transcriptional regulator n=1 Tax=Marinobacterium nitratireducens TaxID=518897 RepID=A0A917Z6R4_9GAMM|nr:TetR/AcrR family transcriptional regulator [Marinobacterium nitratireducens]GGO76634.1 TetR family transcriptional regulator [Marinobacterium nitratireducens]
MPDSTAGKPRRKGKRAAIIAAAVKEFQERGFLETSMDRIAETAQVSKRTVYNHFPSKEELFQSIVTELLDRCGHLEVPEPNADSPIKDQLMAVGRCYAELMTSDDFIKLSRVVLSRFIQSPGLVGSAITGQEPQQPILEWFEAAQQRGLLPHFDNVQATKEFTGLINATEFWPKLISNEQLPGDEARERYLDSIASMFLNHYAP